MGLQDRAARADVADGVAAYERGDYKRAIEEWQPYAAKDDVDALFNLGQVYRLGKGVPQDFEMAEHYYGRAAELGHPVAQGNLATLYYFMKKPKPDKQKAAYWWTRAAKAGDARSQLNLGILYYRGDYVQKDLTKAYAWISLAFRGGIKEASEALDKLKTALTDAQLRQAEAMMPKLVEKPSQDVRIVAPTPPPPVAARPAGQDVRTKTPPKATTATVKPVPVRSSPVAASAGPDAGAAGPTPLITDAPKPAAVGYLGNAAAKGGLALQLASVGSRAAADQEWRKLAKRHGDLIGNLRLDVAKADLGSKGIRYRVRAAGISSRDEAVRLCEALRARKTDCLPVRASGP